MKGRVMSTFCWWAAAIAVYCLLMLKSQPLMVAVWVIVLSTLLYWVSVLFLMPFYRKIIGWERSAFWLAVTLLVWTTLMIPIFFVWGSLETAAMLTVLWCVGLGGWGAVATLNYLRSAGPRIGPLHARTEAVPAGGWKVRRVPKAAPRTGYVSSSRTVQAIESMEVQW